MKAKELAKMLHISPTSVSLALNGKPGISDNLRKKILNAANKEGLLYKSSSILSLQRTIRFIIYVNKGLIVKEISFHSFVLQGIEKKAKELGYNVLVNYLNQDDNLDVQIQRLSRDVDGILFLATEFDSNLLNQNLLQKLSCYCPLVMLDNSTCLYQIDSVSTDNFQGGYQAVNHLIKLGHKKIAYLYSKQRINNFDQRLSGAQQAIFNHNMPPLTLIPVSFNVKKTVYELQTWITSHPEITPSAYICDSDIIAFGAMQAFNACGLSIPHNTSLIGFDDMPACEMSTPPLDSIHVQKNEMGYIGLSILDQRIREQAENTSFILPCAHILLTTQLIIRKSSSKIVIPK